MRTCSGLSRDTAVAMAPPMTRPDSAVSARAIGSPWTDVGGRRTTFTSSPGQPRPGRAPSLRRTPRRSRPCRSDRSAGRAAGNAAAGDAVGLGVADVACRSGGAAQNPAPTDDPGADTGADLDDEQVRDRRTGFGRGRELTDGERVGVVLDMGRGVVPAADRFAHVETVPARHDRRVHDPTTRILHRVGQPDRHAPGRTPFELRIKSFHAPRTKPSTSSGPSLIALSRESVARIFPARSQRANRMPVAPTSATRRTPGPRRAGNARPAVRGRHCARRTAPGARPRATVPSGRSR